MRQALLVIRETQVFREIQEKWGHRVIPALRDQQVFQDLHSIREPLGTRAEQALLDFRAPQGQAALLGYRG